MKKPWCHPALAAAAVALAAVPLQAETSGSATVRSEASRSGWEGDLSPIAASDWSYEFAAHLLERAGFGGPPEEVERLAAMTPAAAVDYLVDYESIDVDHLPEFEESGIYPNGYKYRHLTKVAASAEATGMAFGVKATQEGRLPLQPGVNEYYALLWSDFLEIFRAGQWWAERMVLTPRPFQERMTLFWHDHFATSQQKVHRHRMMLNQIDLLRRNANGNFRDILVEIAQDPAMLIWLDNKDNVKGHPNENFAREIMELFTMGEGRGYSEDDIREVARAFTGWTLTEDVTTASGQGQFVDDPDLHDEGEKSFLGKTGQFDGYDAIEIILQQKETAEYITGKIYRYFVAEELAEVTNRRLAEQFRSSGYEVRPLMKTIFLSKDFYSNASVGSQIKSPVQLLVSTYRKLNLQSVPGIPDFYETTATLNQTLFAPPNVAGWAGHKTWINPATLLARGNFVHELLFPPDPAEYEPPDKVVFEDFLTYPIKFAEYGVVPHIWSRETGRMEPVSLAVYDLYLSGLSNDAAMEMMRSGEGMSNAQMMEKLAATRTENKSQLGNIKTGEKYNLSVGVYTGHVEAIERVKTIPRFVAALDLTAMVRAAELESASQLVDYFQRRFLRVRLSKDREAAVLQFARDALGAQLDLEGEGVENSLREVLHLILSAPEYQLA